MTSARLAEVVAALPLRSGMRVLEIGCGAGAAAREVLSRIGDGSVLAIDRSAKAIAQAMAASARELAAGRLEDDVRLARLMVEARVKASVIGMV